MQHSPLPAAHVRSATLEDVPFIARVSRSVQQLHCDQYPEIFKEPDSDSAITFFSNQLAQDNSRLFLVEDHSSEVVGYAFAIINNKPENPFAHARKTIELEHIAILEHAQGKGYGQLLLSAVCELAESELADDIHLTVWSFNEHAINFYNKAGFSNTRLEFVREFS